MEWKIILFSFDLPIFSILYNVKILLAVDLPIVKTLLACWLFGLLACWLFGLLPWWLFGLLVFWIVVFLDCCFFGLCWFSIFHSLCKQKCKKNWNYEWVFTIKIE